MLPDAVTVAVSLPIPPKRYWKYLHVTVSNGGPSYFDAARGCVFICVGARSNGVEIPTVHKQVPNARDTGSGALLLVTNIVLFIEGPGLDISAS